MKKYSLILAGLLASITPATIMAQGTLVFANSTAKPVTMPDGSLVPRGTTTGPFLAELWAANDFVGGDQQFAFDLVATKIGQPAGFATPVDGVFSGGGRTVNSISPAGGTGLFQVRVWETAYGTTYAEAVANPAAFGVGRAGQSVIFRSDTDDPADPAPRPSLNDAFVPFQLSIIPEPPAIALGLLGASALLLLRRRK
jgi:uncharacterized protein (TIGR03382 family)